MANNRELSQFGSFVSVDDTTKEISIGSTIIQVNATNLNVSGVSTLGIVSSLYVTGVTTVGFLTGTDAYFSGIVTAYKFAVLGPTSIDNLEVNTLKVTGITTLGITTASDLSVYQLKVSGISTFINGPVLIGSGTSTGTTSQQLQVTGGVYVSGNIGIGTTTPKSKLHVQGDALVTGVSTLGPVKIYSNGNIGVVTATSGITTLFYYGDGSELTGIKVSSVGVSSDSTDTSRYISFVDVTSGVTTVRTNSTLTYNPSTGNLGIGTTNPGEKLQVDGNIRVGISTTSNYIAFRGTEGDGGTEFPLYGHTFIGERIYETGTQKSELLLFKGNDRSDSNTFGPDRIRLAATGGIVFDTSGIGTAGTFEQVGTSTALTTKMVLAAITGNLGIGTTAPSTKLHVQGDARVTGAIYDSINLTGTTGQVLKSTETGTKWEDVGATSSSNQITIVDQPSTSSPVYPTFATNSGVSTISIAKSDFVYVPSTGNLGIGTTNPQATLDVGIGSVYISSGDLHINGTPYIFDTRTSRGGYWTNGGLGGLANFGNFTPGGSVGFSVKLPSGSSGTFGAPNFADMYDTVRSTHNGTEGITDFRGRVGIGTTLPKAKLDVNGAVIVSAGATFGGDILPSTSGLNLGSLSNPWDNFYVNKITGTLTGAASSLSVSSDTSDLTRYLTFVDTTSGITSVRTNSTLTYNPSTGNVGIGTTNPLTKLHVSGGDVIIGRGSSISSLERRLTIGGARGSDMGPVASLNFSNYDNTNSQVEYDAVRLVARESPTMLEGGELLIYTTGAGSTIAEERVRISDAGNFGIGTSTPTSKLHVQGDARITGGLYDSGIGAASTTGNKGQILQSVGTGISWVDATTTIGAATTVNILGDSTDQTQYLTFVTGVGDTTLGITTTSSKELTFNSFTGNLGIGTTNPTSTLYVQGNALVTGVSTLGLVKIYSSGNNGIVTATSGINTVFYYGDGSGLTNIKASAISGGSTITISSNSNNQTQYLTFATGIGSTAGLGVTTTNLVFNPFSGNLGIGTTSPKAKLDVNGALLVSAGATFGGNILPSTSGLNIGSLDNPWDNFYVNKITGTLTGAAGSVTVSSDTTDITRYIPFVDTTSGVSSVRANSSLAFNPSTGNLGIGTTNPTSTLHVQGNALVTGVSTLGSVKIYSNGNNGIVTATSGINTVFYYGDGSGLTNIPATAFTGEIGLGTNTYGDYVKNILGTTNEIEVSNTNEEGTTFTIGLPNDVTISTKLTVGGDVQLNTNLNVTGNITVGGTTATLNVNNLQVQDKNIILGVTTSPSTGVDISTDTTANQGGIAIASLGGTPLVKLGISSIPDTYKQIMWLQKNTAKGLYTDAWMFNYGVGIGSTQIANGVRLAVGTGITMSDDSITASYFYGDGSNLKNIPASSISGGSSVTISSNASNQTQYLTFATGIGTTTGLGITTTNLVFNPSTSRLGIGTVTPTSTLHVQGNALVTGISTLGIVAISSTGIITATSIGSTVFYYGDGSGLINLKSSAISGGSSISISSNTDNQAQYLTFAPGTGSTTGLGVTTTGLVFNPSTTRLGIGTTTPTSTLQVQGDIRVSGVSTLSSVKIFSNGTNGIVTSSNPGVSTVFYYGDGSNLTGTIPNSITNIDVNQIYYPLLSQSTSGSISSISVASTSIVFNPGPNYLGIGTTTPTQSLHVQGNVRITGALYASDISGISTSGSSGQILQSVGTGISWVNASTAGVGGGSTISISTNTTNQSQYLTYVTGTGNTTGFGVSTTGLVFNPSTGNLGLGTSIPSARLSVANPNTGNSLLLVNDNLSEGSLFRVSNSAGNMLVDVDSGGTILFPTSGNVGIGTTLFSPTTKLHVDGDVTAKFYYGDGSNLKNLGLGGIGITNTTSQSTPVYPTLAANTTSGITTIGIATTGLSFITSTNTLQVGIAVTPIVMYGNTGVISATSYYGDGSNLKFPTIALAGTTGQVLYNNSGQIAAAANLNYNTATGNVGIGTTIATARLSVSSPTSGNSLLLVNDNLSDGSLFRVSNSAGQVLADVDSSGTILFPTSGNVGIGTTLSSPTTKLHVQGDVRITGALYDNNNNVGAASSVLTATAGGGIVWAAVGGATLNNTPSGTVYPVSAASTTGSLSTAYTSSTAFTFTTSTGTLSATQFTSLSDVNKKKNIRPIENAIDITKKLEGVRFDWIDTGAPSIGVIAQEVEKVLPELVEETDGVKSVSYGNIIGVLIEAIKEQQVRIEELERRI